MKENKKRIIFWGIICIICAGLAIFGYCKFNDGYGEKGKIKKKVEPIVENFLQNDFIIRLGIFEAEATGSGITINNTQNKKEYEFVYSKEKSLEILTFEYNSSDKTNAEIVAKAIIDAIYENNGGTKSVFDTYNYDVFEKSTINNGIALKSGTTTKLTLDLNANIMSKVSQLKLPTIQSLNPAINDGDLTTLLSDLTEKNDKLVEKNNIKIYIKNNPKNYEIYFKDELDSNEYLYSSLINITNVLSTIAADEIINQNITFKKTYTGNNYEVETKIDAKDLTVFEDKTNITKITIQK